MVLKFRLNSFRLVPITVVAMGLVACGPTGLKTKDQKAKTESTASQITGPLDQMNRIVTQWPDPLDRQTCDLANNDIRKKLVQLVEGQYGKESTLKADTPTQKEPQKKGMVRVPFADGSLVKMERMNLQGDDWQSYSLSWRGVDEYYEKNKTEYATSSGFWKRLTGDVSTLMETDFERYKQRKRYGRNLGISKENVHQLEGLYTHLKPCAENESCFSFSWSANELATLKSIPIYYNFVQKMTSASSNDERRVIITKFFTILKDDVEQYSFRKNPTVRTIKEEQKLVYLLPLDASAYTDGERDFLKKSIEDIWNSDQAQVRIEWKLASEDKDIFQVVFQNKNGIRANTTNFGGNKINLYNGTTDRALAHEVGHVLGFPEHYYQVWNIDHCAYETQYNIHDLMSNQFSGSVTSDEWEELFKQYPISTS